MAMSATEAALEGQRIGALQIRVAAICFLAQTFDGFDLNSIGMAAPALSQAWHLPGAAFSITFVMSSIGIMFGALISGPIGDRLGRKPVLLASLVLLTVSSFACAHAGSIPVLAALRFVTGLGIGTLMPASVALACDYVPERRRASMIMVVFTGAPLGRLRRRPVGSPVAADLRLDQHFHGRRPSAAGADPGRAVLAARIPALPAEKGPPHQRDAAVVPPSGHRSRRKPATQLDIARHNPVSGLFRDGLAITTVLVWVLYFSNLLSMYLISYWMPTVLHMLGMTPADAVFAASLRQCRPARQPVRASPRSACGSCRRAWWHSASPAGSSRSVRWAC